MPRTPIRVNDPLGSSVITSPPDREYDVQDTGAAITRLRLLLDQRFFLLRVTLYGLALATLIAFLIPKTYESRAQLMPPDNQLGSGLSSLVALTARPDSALGMLAGEFLGVKTSGSLFIGILRSETVENRIVDKFDLKSVYGVKQMQAARRKLEDNTEIVEDRKSGIVRIRVGDHSKQRAKEIAEAYVVELDHLVIELNTSAAHRERVFLENRLKTVKQDLDASAREFSKFASDNTAIDIKEQGKAMVEAAAILQGRLIAAQSELEGLRQIYTDNNIRVRAVHARIGELQNQLQQMGDGDLSQSGDIQTNSLYPSIRKLPLLGVTYAELYRTNKIQETVFELLTQQCEMAKVQEAKETPPVKVLDAPQLPEKKSFPPRLLIMFLGALLSMMAGGLWILGKSRWDGLDPEHPAKLLAYDAYSKLKGDLRFASRNGMRLKGNSHKNRT
jgi:uncharacterized protein involved in exopolysaccharide biosynthesis